MRTPFIIAEAGSCHEEQLERAINLIAVAKECDADAIKFQYWSSPARMRERRHVTDAQAYEKGSVSSAWLPTLSAYAKDLGLEFMCTAYLPEDIEIVAPFVDKFKVSSFEAKDRDFVNAHRRYEKPLIISTGMSKDGDVWYEHQDTYLQCVSAYPAPLDQASLRTLSNTNIDGYSDHTRCIYTGGFAVSAGADTLEVHFRLDDTHETCPDYPVALSPGGLGAYITLARLACTMRGDGVKRVQPSEQVNVQHKVRFQHKVRL